MATAQSDGSILLNTKVDTSGINKGMSSIVTRAKKTASTAGKAFISIGAAAATATVAITKMATSAYADYEQLVGGVETLFKGSANKVMAYAENAFATAGLSANEYMQNVTSFSASLISSLGGDTDRAADVANAAIVSIADNVNKMGSDYESVQNAFQGFAKQQYMLLDNLKLGYGGTKTEMERLLKDAEAYRASMGETVQYEITNLADVYTAIGDIQEKLGIAGTTAIEAEKTITGSANMMKAAWQNVLTAVSGGGDLDKAINNLVYSIQKYFNNIVPVVERALQGIGTLIERVAPMLVRTVARSLIKAIPSLLNAVYQMIIGLAKGIYEGIVALFNGGAGQVLEKQTNEIAKSVENQNDLTDAVEETNKAVKKGTASFDEINTLSGEAAENESVEPVLPHIDTGVLRDDVDIEKLKHEVSEIGGVFGIIKEKFVEVGNSLYTNFKPSIEALKKEFPKIASAGKDAFKIIGDSTTNVYNNSIKPLADRVANEFVPNIVNSTVENLAPIAGDLAEVYIQNFGESYEWGTQKIAQINSDIVEPAMETLTTITTDSLDDIGEAWDEYGEGITEQLSQVDNNTRTTWDILYEKIAQPIFQPLMEEVDKLWEEHLEPLWKELTLFFGSVSEFALTFYNNVLSPIINYIIDYISPTIVNVINAIRDVVSTVIGWVSDFLAGLIRSFRGLLDFFTGVFTGNWEKAWEGIKDYVGGIWDMIWANIKGIVNLIIDGLNILWRAIYSTFAGIANGIGNAVGWIGSLFGKEWGFSLPAEPPLIPKLAQGAVIPPNKEFLAVLGDQRQGTNIEAPLDTIKQAVAEVLAQVNIAGGSYNGRIEVPVIIDGREIARAVREAEGNMGRQTVFGGFANAY